MARSTRPSNGSASTQAPNWEAKLKQLATGSADVDLKNADRITEALEALTKALSNPLPDDWRGEARAAAQSAFDRVRLNAMTLSSQVDGDAAVINRANEMRRQLAHAKLTELEKFPYALTPEQTDMVKGAAAGVDIVIGFLTFGGGRPLESILSYLSAAREAEAQKFVKEISDAMDGVRVGPQGFIDENPNQGPGPTDSGDRSGGQQGSGGPSGYPGGRSGGVPSSYSQIPGSDINPLSQLTSPPTFRGDAPTMGTLPGHDRWGGGSSGQPGFTPGPGYTPGKSWEPLPGDSSLTPDDATGAGSTRWPGGGAGTFGGGSAFGGSSAFGGGASGSAALLGGAGGGVALAGAKLVAGSKLGSGLAGGFGSGAGAGAGAGAGRAGSGGMMAGGTTGAGGMAGRGGAGGMLGGADGSAGRGGGMMGGGGGAAGGAGGSGKDRRSGMSGLIAPSIDGEDEISARSQAAEAGSRTTDAG